MENENWKAIPGYEGQYEVSDKGRVKSLARTITRKNGWKLPLKERILSPVNANTGYIQVTLAGGKDIHVHRLVLSAFVGPCPEGMEVCHNDGNRKNNRLENLRYGTRLENVQDMMKHGTGHNARKSHCMHGHEFYSENLVPSQIKWGSRNCLICSYTREYIRRHEIPEEWHWAVRDYQLERFLLKMEEV